jgi:carbonic anhydrase/acetyltransferase-like protein (isoleucine patch superfamily)
LGSPAKVVKTLSPEQIEALKHGADHYIKMGAKHAAGEYPLIKS